MSYRTVFLIVLLLGSAQLAFPEMSSAQADATTDATANETPTRPSMAPT